MDVPFGRFLSSPPAGEEVVITGFSGRYPLSKNVDEFRDNIFAKKDLVTKTRWDLDNPSLPKRGAFMDDLDRFDVGFFGLHHRQANLLDPMVRQCAETTIEAIIDAGLHPSELEGTRTGVFIGACFSDVEATILMNIQEEQKFGVTGYIRCIIANRISYYLKLKGPSIVVDTACSSSANALENAFKAIRTGQCDNAIVGGVNICLHPSVTIQFQRLGVLSLDGTCKVFDEDADGYVRSEASVSILLQKAKNARRIYAEIIYAKVNDDGFKYQGINFPSSEMQEQLMKEVLRDSNIHPSDLSYLEAHGTGTKVGDPEEVAAIDNAIARHRAKPLWTGSVKCNIGHSEPASGLCSLSKVIFAMETGRIPPNMNLKKIRSELSGIREGRLKIVTDKTNLEGEEAIAGINNFGFGGNNCHILVRRFKKAKTGGGAPQDDLPRLVCVSGRTENAVVAILDGLKKLSLDSEYVGLLHQAFRKNFNNHPYRGFAILSKNRPVTCSQRLCQYSPFTVYFGKLDNSYKVLGKHLLEFSGFKNILFKINNYLLEKSVNVVDLILKKQTDTNYDLLGTIVVQVGIVELFKSLQVNPSAVYGESIGKVAVKYYYEAITLEEAILTAYKWAKSEKNKFSFENNISELKSVITNGESVQDPIYSNSRRVKHGPLLNVSDSRLSDTDMMLVEGNVVKFLEFLGSLYELGHNPQIHNLYPEIQYPVSRGTPSISPYIRWNHDKSWYTYKFEQFCNSNTEEMEFQISSLLQDCKYMTGHVIDGRNLVPAAEYLRMAWEALSQFNGLYIYETPVIFENCKFIKAVTLNSNFIIKMKVIYQPSSGNFKIFEGDSLIVSGQIFFLSKLESQKLQLKPLHNEENDSALFLKQDEIYRELYLRGYNYSGLFKGITRSNVEATVGFIQWENNWTAFIDKMLQMKILQIDTRLLYVPVGITRIIIDPFEHFHCTGEEDVELPVHLYKECDVIKSGGIEIHGLKAKAISKRKPRLEPVLEKHQFVPNESPMDLITAIRINVQIVLENTLENNFKAVEINDAPSETDTEFLLPLISQVLEDVPLIKPELVISTKDRVKVESEIKIENFAFNSSSGLTLIVGNRLLQKSNLELLLSSLSQNGFALSREDRAYVFNGVDFVDVVTQYVTEQETLILFRKAKDTQKTKYIEVSSERFDWLPILQQAVKNEHNIVLYSQNQNYDGVMGLVNCLRREPGGIKIKCFFIMDKAPKFDPQHQLYQSHIRKDLAINVYKNTKWGTYRHLLLENVKDVESEHIQVCSIAKGDLSSLSWMKGSLTQQTAGDILIHIYYCALNFKDVMIATGRIDLDAFSYTRLEQELTLGMEFAGRDTNGRRVAGMAFISSLSSLLTSDKTVLWSIPDSWTMEDAATVSVVYNTVLYALLKVITVKPGISILIHSATGGVGLAALNVCLYHKCQVFVTVGTQEKRDFLKKHYPQIPDSHIGNSRDTSFENMIKLETKGRGVDVVLNSLTEEKLIASIQCLAKGGSFLEIGKYDLANNHALSLLLFEKGITYHGVTLDRIDSPEMKQWLIDSIVSGINLGFVKPLPRTVFKKDEVESAFRYMTTGKHIGKVLVKVREEEAEKIVKPTRTLFNGISRFSCDFDKCYVIIGGLGGMGLELADWLILKGARKVVLVTSSGVKTGYQAQRIRTWKSYDVVVQISQCDVTTREGCFRLLSETNALGPIDGIFNLAVVLKDALFEDQSEETFNTSLAPKAHSTIYLDEISRELCPNLRHFVVFSSVSCGRGNAGQTNYGMANSIMERICERRKKDGLPGLAIQWGAIGDVGLVAKMQKENKELVIGGTLQQKVSNCLEVLDTFLNQDNPVVSSMVVAEKSSRNSGSESAVDAISVILGIKDMKTISQHATFAELGMDSMMGTEMIQVLEKDFEIYVTPKEVRSLTFAKLTEIENEKKSAGNQQQKDKSVEGVVSLLQYIPEHRTGPSKIFELPRKLNNGTETGTVFVFSGMEGVFKPLERLTDNLKGRVLGVQYNYNDPEDSVEETAQNILPHMKKYLTQEKTFRIVAYSFGVLVALEVATALEKEGYVGIICAIEGSPEYSSAAAKQNIAKESDEEIQTSLTMKIMSIVLPADLLRNEQEKFQKCKNLDERIDLGLSLIPPNALKNSLEKQGAVCLYKRLKALINYSFVHEKIKSNVKLFKAKYPMVTDIDDDYGLSKCCQHSVEVTIVDGHHVTILNQDELVENIQQALQN